MENEEFIKALKEYFCYEKTNTTCENDIEQPTCPSCNKIDELAEKFK